jgi:hypothetical protein
MESFEVYDVMSDLTPIQNKIGLALVIGTVLLIVSSLIGSTETAKKRKEEIHTRNSKLAIMLMMILMENPQDNKNYILMAKNIGCEHLVKGLDEVLE